MADTGGVDVSLAPNSNVILEPAESLSFHLQPQAAPQAVLTIRNVSDSRKIAFKVKTTRPLRYLVRPNQGMLGPNGTASIMVILQQRDCDELLRLDPSERQLSNDKFLVQSIYADDSFYELVKTKSAKEMADDLTNMWAHTDKKSLSNKKLRCRFVQDDQQSTAAGSGNGGQPSNATLKAESPLSSRFPSKSSIYSSSNSLLPLKQTDEPSRPSEDVATPAQLTAALLQESAAEKAAHHKVEAKVQPNALFHSYYAVVFVSILSPSIATCLQHDMSEVAALRKKYDELVAFTVQLTAQRDVLMTDLEKTRQLLQKASSDAQRVKKLNDDAPGGGSTLRQRKPGAAGANGGSSDDAQLSKTANGVKDPAVCS